MEKSLQYQGTHESAMDDSTALQAIFDRLEAGKQLKQQELQVLVEAVRSQQITIAMGDRAVAIGGSADGAVIVTGDRNIVITGADVETIRKLMGKRPRAERQLLQNVKDEVTSRLKWSLHNQVLIQLGMEAQSEQVKRPWDSDIKIGNRPDEPISDTWDLLKVFDEVKGKLLILGNPGTGKTTMILELAQELCNCAEQQIDQPIPVLLNLSTWKDNSQSIHDWLLLELKSKYGVRKDTSEELIDDARLLLILDGLDELESIRQEPCVQKINQLLQSEYRPQQIVVCSRQEEYATYATKLQLNGAIYLHPLNDTQIQNYLTEIECQELWQAFSNAPELFKIIHIPLFLNVMILAYQRLTSEEWEELQATENPLQFLWDIYIYQMLTREVSNGFYIEHIFLNEEQVYFWLLWLASQLEIDFQSEFLIEEMQPSWLPREVREGMYFWVNYAFIMLTLSLYLILSASLTDFGVILGFASWIFTIRVLEIKTFVDTEKWSWDSAKVGLLLGLLGSLRDSLNSLNVDTYLEIFSSFYDKDIWSLVFNSTLRALNNQFTFWLVYGLLILQAWSSDNWIRCSLIVFLSSAVFILITSIYRIILAPDFDIFVPALLINFMIAGLTGALTGLLIGGVFFQSVFRFIENSVEMKFRIIEFKEWSFDNAKNGAIIGFLFGLIIGIIFQLIDGAGEFVSKIILIYDECWIVSTWHCGTLVVTAILQDLTGGLISALSFGFIGGFIGGLGFGEFIFPTSNESILTPNQGVWTTLRNATIIGISSLTAGIVTNLFNWSRIGLFLDMVLALSVWLWTGGYLCVQHLIIRITLFYKGYTPWNYARFLNYCTDRLLLQRVGGRYRFIHRLLQEHFAAMPWRE